MASVQAHLLDLVIRLRMKPKLRRADLVQARRVMEGAKNPTPADARIRPAALGGVPGEWVERGPAKPGAPALLYLHGGGYIACSPRTHRSVTTGFAARGFRVHAPEYRLAPEHPFPAAVEDAVAVYRGLIEAGEAPGRIVVAGESAGGGLTLALLLALRDAGLPLPAAAAVFSPWVDLANTGASIRGNARREAMLPADGISATAAAYLDGADPRTPTASPLYAELRGLPPLLVHVGEREILRDDATRLAERAREAGVRTELKLWPVVPHAWQLMHAVMPEGRRSLAEAAAFLHAAIA